MGITKNSQFFVEDGGHNHSSANQDIEFKQELDEMKSQALRYKSELDNVKREVHLMLNELSRVKRDYHQLQSWTSWMKGGLTLAMTCLMFGAGGSLLGSASLNVFRHTRVNLVTR